MGKGESVQEEQVLTSHLSERIGIYGSNSLKSQLESTFGNLPYAFIFHGDLGSLHQWIQNEHPRLIIIEGSALDGDVSPEGLEGIKKSLRDLGTMTILVTHSPEEIERWRNGDWPQMHFHHGKSHVRDLKRRILAILADRVLEERPLVAICTEKPYLAAHLEMMLKNYGMRVTAISSDNEGDRSQALLCDGPDALLWDVDFGNVNEALAHLKKFSSTNPPSFFIAEKRASRPDTTGSDKRDVFTLDRVDQLMLTLRESILKGRDQHLTECRDPATGLYLPEFFSETVRRELKSSERCGDKFSVMRFSIHDHDGIQSEYGPIFARELVLNLGLFIQERVRGSDVVAKGRGGEVWLLLSRLGRDLATLVGERLRHSFSQAASFEEEGMKNDFKPRLSYMTYAYPLDFKTSEELIRLIDSREEIPLETGLRSSPA